MTPESVAIDYLAVRYPTPPDALGAPNGLQLLVDTLPRQHQPLWQQLVSSVHSTIGPDRTVWGVKVENGLLSWELYFYFMQPELVRQAVEPVTGWDIGEVSAPGGTCSIEIRVDHDGRPEPITSIDLYRQVQLSDTICRVATCHTYGADGLQFKNHYTFVPASEYDQIHRCVIDGGNYLDPDVPSTEVLRPEFVDCKVVCVAAKRGSDGVYFGGVDHHQFLDFIKWAGFPDELATSISRWGDDLSHIRFDVGFDYKVRDGEAQVIKAGFYGWF